MRFVVSQVRSRAGLEIVNPDIVGHAAAVMFPGAELAEDAVESHLGIVGREGGEAAARERQLLRQLGVEPDGVELAEEGVESFLAGTKHDEGLRVFPSHHDVVRAHAIGDIVAAERGGGGEALRRAAFTRHHIDFGIAVILRGERELRPIGRETREGAVAGTAR